VRLIHVGRVVGILDVVVEPVRERPVGHDVLHLAAQGIEQIGLFRRHDVLVVEFVESLEVHELLGGLL
jgi:hypothetical protein